LLRNRGSTWEHVEAARRGYILEYSRLSQHPSPRPRPTPRGVRDQGMVTEAGHRPRIRTGATGSELGDWAHV
jgi:hypothetical protein